MKSRVDVVPMILEIACRATGMGFAAVTAASEGRWVFRHVRDTIGLGLRAGDEFKYETIVGDESMLFSGPVVISDLSGSPDNDITGAQRTQVFRSYISQPIHHSDRTCLETLCALDREPRDLEGSEEMLILRILAELIGVSARQTSQLAGSEADLTAQCEAAELREQFIAVMGHDLRNPLAAIQSGITLIENTPSPERATLILRQMRSSAERMATLIADVLDLTRGRLGGGMTLKRKAVFVDPVIEQVVAELASTHPNHMISAECSFNHAIDCDPDRLAQLISNLLGNALTHGASEQPVRILCECKGNALLLSVSNGGSPISPDAIERLFQPFVRGGADADQDGLGLGLYIAAQIAKAHGGDLTVKSNEKETRFSFEMPLAATIVQAGYGTDLQQ